MKRPFTYEKRAFGLLRDYFFIGKECFVVTVPEMVKCRFFKQHKGNTKFVNPKVTIGI